ncbi:MAG: hypothetical protein ABEJ97_05700 [Halobellus sp.]
MSSSSTRDTDHSRVVPPSAVNGRWRSAAHSESNQYEPLAPDARAQTTPVVALIALFAVCTGVALYATALTAATPTETGNDLAEPTLDRVHDAVSTGGVVDPFALTRADAPDGYRIAVAVTTDRGRFGTGGPPPRAGVDVDRASRPVGVAVGTGDVVWGRLTVWVWR